MPLNINWQQILLHLFNFIILFAVLYFLIYKSVKQFMDKRIEYYKKLEAEAKKNLADSEQAKKEYSEKLVSVDDEIFEKKEKAKKAIEEANAVRIRQAEEEAERIIADAHKSIENEHKKMLKEAQNDIADMVASAAEKLAVEAITSDTYDLFLNTVKGSDTDE